MTQRVRTVVFQASGILNSDLSVGGEVRTADENKQEEDRGTDNPPLANVRNSQPVQGTEEARPGPGSDMRDSQQDSNRWGLSSVGYCLVGCRYISCLGLCLCVNDLWPGCAVGPVFGMNFCCAGLPLAILLARVIWLCHFTPFLSNEPQHLFKANQGQRHEPQHLLQSTACTTVTRVQQHTLFALVLEASDVPSLVFPW